MDVERLAKKAKEVEKVRININTIIQARFGEVSQQVMEVINAIDDKPALEKLFTSSIIVADFEDFQKRLQAIVSGK